MTNKERVLRRAGITAIIFPFILLIVFYLILNSQPQDWQIPNPNFFTFFSLIGGIYLVIVFFIIGIFLITLSLRYRLKNKENKPTAQKEKLKTSEKQGKNDGMSSNSNTIVGLIIIFFALLVFFLFPLNIFIEIPSSIKAIVGKDMSLTFYGLFSVCSQPTVSILISQCGLIMFISVGIFIAIIIGLILLIKGLIKK